MSVKGTIVVGKNTANHKAWLESHGYVISQEGSILTVEGSGFVQEIDLSEDALGILKTEVLDAKKLLTYTTRAKVVVRGEVKVLRSIPLCTILGPASALVVKPIGEAPVKVVSPFATL